MRVIENFLCGKENNPLTCEDGIFISEKMVVVIDGVTAKGKRLWDGKSSGCFAKDIIIDFLQKNFIEKLDAESFLKELDLMIWSCVIATEENVVVEDYPRAAVIIYNEHHHEVWSYGDCQCRINDVVYKHAKKVDEINESIRANVLKEYLQNGYTVDELRENDPGRAMIQENLLKQFSYENQLSNFGYPVLNGQGIESRLIKKNKVKPGDEITLATDGYPELKGALVETEAYLQKALELDPLCIKECRSTKALKVGNGSFDDRAYCRVLVE